MCVHSLKQLSLAAFARTQAGNYVDDLNTGVDLVHLTKCTVKQHKYVLITTNIDVNLGYNSFNVRINMHTNNDSVRVHGIAVT